MAIRPVTATVLWSAAFALLTIGCEEPAPPVGQVELQPREISLRYPGFSGYRLLWKAEAPVEGRVGDLRAKVHLLGEDGDVLRTFDHVMDFEWSPGVSESREQMLFQSALAPPLGEGEYELEIGLYDEGGNVWEVTSPGATVRVEPATEGFPAFYFSPEWLPIETGTDLQILGRRWLRADGLIRLGELTRPGTLWLQIGIPTPREGEHELVLDEGATEPQVEVRSTCGTPSQRLQGVGSHQVMLEIGPGEDGVLAAQCEVAIDANYTMVALEDGARRTIALECLSWLTG